MREAANDIVPKHISITCDPRLLACSLYGCMVSTHVSAPNNFA